MTEPQADGMNGTRADMHVHSLFILDEDRKPVPCPNIDRWAKWFEDQRNSHLAYSRIGGVTISTKFIGVRLPAPPESGLESLFFETSITRGFFCGHALRTQTYNGAMHAHGVAVGAVTRFRYIPAFIQDALRFTHELTNHLRFHLARIARALFF